MNATSYSQFRLRINVRADAKEVYRLWATQQGLESWFLREARFTDTNGSVRNADDPIQKGDEYTWRWHGHPDAVVEKGTVLMANGTDKFGFTFSMGCPVHITIFPEHDELIVELTESELPTDDATLLKHYVGDSRGWIFYLANLKSILEGGLDLRNKRLEIQNVISA